MPRGGKRSGAGRPRRTQKAPAQAPQSVAPAQAEAPPAQPTPAEPNPLLAKCTRREQVFILNLLGDPEGNQTRAYERSGFKARGASAAANAAKCLKKDRVRAAFDSLRGEVIEAAKSKAIADATERRTLLTTLQRDTAVHPLARIRAIDVHNKMDGEYVERHEVEHKIPGSIAFVVTRQVGAENRT